MRFSVTIFKDNLYRVIWYLSYLISLGISWIKLGFSPYPDKTMNKIRVLLKYLELALRSRVNLEQEFKHIDVDKTVWDFYRPWIMFQLRFVKSSFWTLCPVMVSVTGGFAQKYLHEVAMDNGVTPDSASHVASLAMQYQRSFRGYSFENFFMVLVCHICF